MRRTTLGPQGPHVGRIGLGTMGMSCAYDPAHRDDDTSVRVINDALDLGVTLIDTADVYGPFTNEEVVGRALAGRRSEAVLATKGGVRLVGGEVSLNGRPSYLRATLDASLRRLQTDHVDVYFLHRVDPAVPIEESWGAMAELVQAGKARRIGISEMTLDQLVRAHRAHPVAAVQSELSLFTRDFLADVVPFCQEQGIAFLCHSPIGSGLLSGRFRTPDDVGAGDERSTMPRFAAGALPANNRLVDAVRGVGARHGATAAQVALAWLLARGPYIIPIPGTKTPRFLAENAAAADLELTAEDIAELDALPAPVGARE
jgi:aryl-alcohol dehydrogenase-like predicted oxidoreductase